MKNSENGRGLRRIGYGMGDRLHRCYRQCGEICDEICNEICEKIQRGEAGEDSEEIWRNSRGIISRNHFEE